MELYFVCYRSLWFGKLLSNHFFVSCTIWTMNIKILETTSAFALSNDIVCLPTCWTMEVSLHYYLIICFKIRSQLGGGGYHFPLWWKQFHELIKKQKEPASSMISFPGVLKASSQKEIFFPTPLDILRFSRGTAWPQNKSNFTSSTLVRCLWVGGAQEQGKMGLWGTKEKGEAEGGLGEAIGFPKVKFTQNSWS